MEGDGEAMSFVANLLDQMQHGRMMVEDHRLIFTTENVENLFFLGDAGHRLIDDGEFVEGFGGGVELADAAIDLDQAGEGLVFGLQAAVAAFDPFPNAAKTVAQNSPPFL